MTSGPWPLLKALRQGDIEETAIVDTRGEVIARVSAPEAYQGDLRTAVERGDFTAQIVHAATSASDLYAALEMVRDADDDCKRDGLPTIPVMARAKIDAALHKAMKE